MLKEKSHAFETFKNFRVWIQNEAQSCIGSLYTDNGREYTSNKFENYLHQHGMKHQTTIPYNCQHNSAAERMNMTLLNMVRSIMFSRM